jgi:hypothetical protein
MGRCVNTIFRKQMPGVRYASRLVRRGGILSCRAQFPKGPSPELVAAILAMKTRNPRFGSRRIAAQLAFAFRIDIDKDVVRRFLAKHWRPQGGGGPSWLSFLGHWSRSGMPRISSESSVAKYRWQPHRRGLYELPVAGKPPHTRLYL